MSPLLVRITGTCALAAAAAFAQTPAEYDTIKQSLLSVQQKAANSLAVLDAPSRPANWQSLITADMNAAVTAAQAASAAAQSATVTRYVSVPAGTNLQTAINAAVPGDTLVLQAGAVYTGSFALPAKSGTGYITITTSALASLPEGVRVTPASAVYMPQIVNATGAPAFITAPGAHHYRLIGLDVTCAAGIYCNTLIQVGTGAESTDAALPHTFELDRLYLHGSTAGGKRGAQLNGKSVTLRNSHLSGFFSSSQETQATGAWNTPGPLTVENNYLEASGMGLMIGGADPALVGATPSDITITRNHITRPLEWRPKNYMVKNLLELKTGRNVKITGNVLENTWTAAQVGYAFNIKRGTENVKTPAITSGVIIADNIIRRAAGVVSIGVGCSDVTVRNNLLEDIGGSWGMPPLFAVYGASNVAIENNTGGVNVVVQMLVAGDYGQTPGFVFRGNILPHGVYGIKGNSTPTGLGTLTAYFPGSVVSNNVLYGSVVNPAIYPAGNSFPVTMTEVGFTDAAAGKYKLSLTSPYRGTGVGGQDPGIGTGPLF
jgi:hypothetical protein